MSERDGVLTPYNEVHCARCERPVLGLPSSKREAAAELETQYHWRRIRGKWHCYYCAATPQLIKLGS